ncbi:MAG: hypothetical protein INQ03_22125 [Candidatus Heimdallarchaeota archaeon]|nr:hypothetical protein [Candidatus Heimdallarchaeota archaeon]
MSSVKEKLKQKLDAGEIDQEEYESLLKKFEDLDILDSTVSTKEDKKHKVVATGFTKLTSDVVDGPVKVSGKLSTEQSLKCESMTISGSANINGDLSVVGFTKISGKLNVEGDAKFGDVVKISGGLTSEGDTYFTNSVKISGKVMSKGKIVLGDDAKISGKISCPEIKSTALLKISGKLDIAGNVLVKEFISNGGGVIGGNLQADLIEVSKKAREGDDVSKLSKEAEELDSIPALGSFISRMVTSFIPSVMNGIQTFSELVIEKDVRGNTVDLSYVHVKGDVYGHDVKIGPNVKIDGKIKYVNTIELPDDEFSTEQIDPKDFEVSDA